MQWWISFVHCYSFWGSSISTLNSCLKDSNSNFICFIFQLFSKEYINLLLTVYFFVIGVVCITNLLRPLIAPLIPTSFPNSDYHLVLVEGKGDNKEALVDFKFDRIDLVDLALAAVIGGWYLLKKHWIANNIFGLAFSLTGVEALHLNR